MPTYLTGYDPAVPIASLVPARDNPRKPLKQTDPERFAALTASMERGVFSALLVEQSSMEVVGGHQRLEAARALGMATLPVLYLRDLSPEEKRRIRVADNTHFGTRWDIPELRDQVLTLPTADVHLLGLEDWLLNDLALDPPALDPEPEPEEKEQWKTFRARVSVEQLAVIKEALDRVRDEAEDPKSVPDGMALAKLCIDYLADGGHLRE